MKCDRCLEEKTTYKYLKNNYCHRCVLGLYYVSKCELAQLRQFIEEIDEKIKASNVLRYFEDQSGAKHAN